MATTTNQLVGRKVTVMGNGNETFVVQSVRNGITVLRDSSGALVPAEVDEILPCNK